MSPTATPIPTHHPGTHAYSYSLKTSLPQKMTAGVMSGFVAKKKAAGPRPSAPRLAGELCALGVHDLAEQFPALALEALQLHGLHRIVVGRAGADGDARQQARHAQLLMVGGLLHEVLVRQIVGAILQRLLP